MRSDESPANQIMTERSIGRDSPQIYGYRASHFVCASAVSGNGVKSDVQLPWRTGAGLE